MSVKIVRNIHGTLTKALSTAVDIGYLRINSADRITLPQVVKKEFAPLTDEQVKDFLREASNDDLEIILKVILFTGLRESEALGLTWDNIDFKAGTLKVCKQLQKRRLADGGATLAPTKNGKSRTLKPASFYLIGSTENRPHSALRWAICGKDGRQQRNGKRLWYLPRRTERAFHKLRSAITSRKTWR